MGFLDSILKDDKPQKAAGDSKYTNPFNVTVGFSPLRLSAKRSSCVSLLVKVKNVSPDPQLVSVDALLPKNVMVGFDRAGINKAEPPGLRLGSEFAGELSWPPSPP